MRVISDSIANFRSCFKSRGGNALRVAKPVVSSPNPSFPGHALYLRCHLYVRALPSGSCADVNFHTNTNPYVRSTGVDLQTDVKNCLCRHLYVRALPSGFCADVNFHTNTNPYVRALPSGFCADVNFHTNSNLYVRTTGIDLQAEI